MDIEARDRRQPRPRKRQVSRLGAPKRPEFGTADISPSREMQLSYDLPAGDYAVLDFNQDMKTGRPDTLEGMYAVVTLR